MLHDAFSDKEAIKLHLINEVKVGSTYILFSSVPVIQATKDLNS